MYHCCWKRRVLRAVLRLRSRVRRSFGQSRRSTCNLWFDSFRPSVTSFSYHEAMMLTVVVVILSVEATLSKNSIFIVLAAGCVRGVN
jgi:hypothetical protein